MNNDETIVSRKYKNKRIRTQQPLSEFVGKKNHVNHPVEDKVIIEESKKCINSTVRKNKKDTKIKKFINGFEANTGVNICSESEKYDEEVLNLLRFLKRKFDEKWKKNENKARAHRVMVTGLHEVAKHLKNHSIKVIFISRNMDGAVQNWFGCSNFMEIFRLALSQDVPIIHTNTKKQLSSAVKKFPYINIIGVMAFNGLESTFGDIHHAWKKSRSHILYHNDQSSLLP